MSDKETTRVACGAATESETERYFKKKRDIDTGIKIMEHFGGKGMFTDEFSPAIYRLKGMLAGMEVTERSFAKM